MRNPLLHNPVFVRRYALGTVPLLALLVAAVDVGAGAGLAPRLLLSLPFAVTLPFLGLGYGFVALAHPMGETRLPTLLGVHGAAAVLGTLVWMGLGSAGVGLAGLLSGWGAELAAALDRNRTLLVTVGLSGYAVLVLVYSLLLSMERQQDLTLREESLVNLAKDAELRALKLQLNPHFLFNALNSVSALTTSAPERARTMCIGLADFLRRTLAIGERPAVTLEEELALARDYLALERVRFGDRLVVTEDTDHACLPVLVPPLVLQPLLENAVKHGLGSLLGPVRLGLRARRSEGRLEVEVTNDADDAATSSAPGVGLGLRNTRERIHRYAPGEGRVAVDRGEGRFSVTLVLPWEEAR